MKKKVLIIVLSLILAISSAVLVICIILSRDKSLKFAFNTKYVYVNESVELKYSCNYDCKVEYSIEDESKAYINGHIIHGVSVGKTNIFITVYTNKEKYKFTETISVLEKESYYFSQLDNIDAAIGDEINLAPTITANASSANFTYLSSNEDIVSINSSGIAKVNQFGEVSISVFNHNRLVKTYYIKSLITYSITTIANCEYVDGELNVEKDKNVIFELHLASGNKNITNFSIEVLNENLDLDIVFNKVILITQESFELKLLCTNINYPIILQIKVI